MIIHPYLYFDGDCHEAITFYQSVFEGEIAAMSTYDEQPGDDPVPEGDADRVMHAALNLGTTALMASDVPSSMGDLRVGQNIHLNTSLESVEECQRVFNALADGGAVTMPFEQQFWGAWMGNVTDRFGIHWMISHPGSDD